MPQRDDVEASRLGKLRSMGLAAKPRAEKRGNTTVNIVVAPGGGQPAAPPTNPLPPAVPQIPMNRLPGQMAQAQDMPPPMPIEQMPPVPLPQPGPATPVQAPGPPLSINTPRIKPQPYQKGGRVLPKWARDLK